MHWLKTESSPELQIQADIDAAEDEVARIVCSGDGLQASRKGLRKNRHRANATYNLMRGGVPVSGYRFPRTDFVEHLGKINPQVLERQREALSQLEEQSSLAELRALAVESEDLDFERIASEYLPLTFGRRHGDPTRPWNEFNIATHDKSGQPVLSYEGNWRDIFQNWEALGISFPELLPSMVLRFANTSTVDGYNPYRINKTGFDWEKVDPDDPWANIGYWGDHQIVYCLRLIESARRVRPEALDSWLQRPVCVFADVPYRIADYKQILESPSNTIEFEQEKSKRLIELAETEGEDVKLVGGAEQPVRCTLAEKLLISGLTKLGNLIPDAGIWLNTQRPEWNDANNALVGNGASVVTTFYLARYFDTLKSWWHSKTLKVAKPIQEFMEGLREALVSTDLSQLDPGTRKHVVDRLQEASERYRRTVYASDIQASFEQKVELSADALDEFFNAAVSALVATHRSNRRPDSLFHSYNLVEFTKEGAVVEHLDEMLEGQVAALASGTLDSAESLMLLRSLRVSQLYRADAGSYMLYPNLELDRFLDKNLIDPEKAGANPLVQELLRRNDSNLIVRDVEGQLRFVGDFRNAAELGDAISALIHEGTELATLLQQHGQELCELFEETFDHRRFTGRSRTFFAYEGLGSIYWHMVSKLVLATFEAWQVAMRAGAGEAEELLEIYRELRDGLGLGRMPAEYGAFPTIPYSHTPLHAGAQQPGMTGQVKEDLISRMGELGVVFEKGIVRFELEAFEVSELSSEPMTFQYWDVAQKKSSIDLESGFAFTLCQTPVLYRQGPETAIEITYADGTKKQDSQHWLSPDDSASLFSRAGKVRQIQITHPFK